MQRLAAVAGEARWQQAIARGERYLDWARELDRPAATPSRCKRPEPKPPLEARPKSLSVTEIEQLAARSLFDLRQHVLRLRPLDAVDTPPGARDRGTVVHEAIGDFTEQFKDELPDDRAGRS